MSGAARTAMEDEEVTSPHVPHIDHPRNAPAERSPRVTWPDDDNEGDCGGDDGSSGICVAASEDSSPHQGVPGDDSTAASASPAVSTSAVAVVVAPPPTTRDLIHGLLDGHSFEVTRPWRIGSIAVVNITTLIIIISIVEFSIGTLPHFHKNPSRDLNAVEAACISYFVLEFVVRVATAPSQRRLWSSLLTWVDVLSIVPYFVHLAVADLMTDGSSVALLSLRVLRLVRVVRVLKLFKQNEGFDSVFEAFSTSRDALSLMLFMLAIALTIFSAALYFAEIHSNKFDRDRDMWVRPDGSRNPFQSVIHSMWWCIVTLTTVGYGDDVPVTSAGKVISGVTAICGVFVVSFPTAILGATFSEAFTRRRAEKKRKEALKQIQMRRAEEAQQRAQALKPEMKSKLHNSLEKVRQIIRGRRRRSTAAPSAPDTHVGPAAESVPSPLIAAAASVPMEERRKNSEVYRGFTTEGESRIIFCLGTSQQQLPREAFVTERANALLGEKAAIVVRYGPALMLQTASGAADDPMVLLRAEDIPGTQCRYVHVRLLLDDVDVRDAVELALRESDFSVSEQTAFAARPVETLRVSMVPPPTAADVELLTTKFMRPVGFVTLTLRVPDREQELQLLHNIGGLSFQFSVTYQEPSDFELPPMVYNAAQLLQA